jgi:DNA-binding CsgD family transcriptional regulator
MSDEPTPPVDDKTELTRDGTGKFTRSFTTAQRDAEAARLRTRNYTYAEIGERLGMSKQAAQQAVKRVMDEVRADAAEDVVQFEEAKLNAAEQLVWAVLDAKHVTVQHGRLVLGLDDLPLEDHGPVLAAVDRLVKISESRRKLLGRDAAQKLDLSGEVTYQIIGVDPDVLT